MPPFTKEQFGQTLRAIDGLNRVSARWEGTERREMKRFVYLRLNLNLEVHRMTGDRDELCVISRNISPGGISVLHRGYVNEQSACNIELPKPVGEPMLVHSRVAKCRHIQGSLHESSIVFECEVDPFALFLPAELEAHRPKTAEKKQLLRGVRALLVGFDEPTRSAVGDSLDGTGCVLNDARDLGDALDQVRRTPFDAVLCGDLFKASDRPDLVSRLRMIGRFRNFVVLLGWPAADVEKSLLFDQEKKTGGCDPFDEGALLEIMPRRRRSAA